MFIIIIIIVITVIQSLNKIIIHTISPHQSQFSEFYTKICCSDVLNLIYM